MKMPRQGTWRIRLQQCIYNFSDMTWLLLLCCTGPSLGPQPGSVTYTPVFSRGEGGCSAFRIPGLASLNGTIHVFAECRKYDCADNSGQVSSAERCTGYRNPPRYPPTTVFSGLARSSWENGRFAVVDVDVVLVCSTTWHTSAAPTVGPASRR